MKKLSLQTRNFIENNIIINAAAYSYPQRIVAPINKTIKSNTSEPAEEVCSKTLNPHSFVPIRD